MGFLQEINCPQDLKKLSSANLIELAEEIRTFLLKTVAHTGGHLAANLGVVELTLALHYVFDTTKDRLVWDVGHQSYVHKILTGRKNSFSSLRQYDGLSGFPKREESIHDAFNTGHSSTSISAVLGFALAREKLGEDYKTIAVIGDGSMTGGQAYEALNQAGHLKTDLLVVLNDNEMSIAQNVGAMSSYLSRLRSDPFYMKRKKDIEYLLHKVPAIGSSVAKAAERVKDSLKYLLVPGMLFEELGFTYLGPIDGHDIQNLIVVLKKTKDLKGPILLHVLTQKGKGYAPAANNPAIFHGVGSFDLNTGEIMKSPGPPTYTNVFAETLIDLAAQDERIVAITAAMPEGTGLSKFAEKYPERCIDVGIGEQNAVTMAAAMASKGIRPVVAIYSSFLQRAYDQILHDVCLPNIPVILAIDRAGLVGEDGSTHHGIFDFSYLRHIPGMSILAPADEAELRQMLYTALFYDGPVAIRYPRGQARGVPIAAEYEQLPWGKGKILTEGSDILILAIGSLVYPALKTREFLLAEGFSCTVVNTRFVKPLDQELILEKVPQHKYIVTMEENVVAGGFGSGVLELLSQKGKINNNFLMLGLPDEFVTHGPQNLLREKVGLTPEVMAERIMEHFALQRKTKKPRIFLFNSK
jgi:1-deoxy-D-xylulose-5-phosphate synthase